MLLPILAGCEGPLRTALESAPREISSEEDIQAGSPIEWYASFKEATQVSRAQDKPMMLVFYGVSGRRLDERVFSDPDVIELAQNFVCLKVGAGQGDLAEKYRVQEFPAIIFADPQGGEYDRSMGYKSRSSLVKVLRTALIPVEAEYSLHIKSSEPGLASVSCIFRNVRSKSLTLVLRERQNKMFSISYDSTHGRPGWEETEKNVWLMKFSTPALRTVIVKYEVGLNVISRTSYQPEYVSYVGDNCSVLDGHALFLEPQDLHTMGKVEVRMALPTDWRAITPWEENDHLSFTADSLQEVVDSVFCVGQFQFAERRLGEHGICAVYCGDEENITDLEQKVDEIFRIFEDYVMRFGDFPFKRYLAVFAGSTSDRKYVHGSAHAVGFSGPVNVGYTFTAHEIFHVWNGGIVNQKSDYEGWFKEGFTQYYGYLTPYRVGLYSKERFLWFLKRDYEEYLMRYGTESDMALTNVKEELARKEGYRQPESDRLWIMYYKGALVAALMDNEIRKRTDGAKTLDDLMYHIFHEFRDRKYSSQDVLEALNTVTGQDFTQFFSDFVYGKTRLPNTTVSYQ